jgi:AraC-like DNA-binding protein
MVSCNFHFVPSALRGHIGSVVFRVRYEGQQIDIPTPYLIWPDEWDERNQKLIFSRCDDNNPKNATSERDDNTQKPVVSERDHSSIRKRILAGYAKSMVCDIERIEMAVGALEASGCSRAATLEVGSQPCDIHTTASRPHITASASPYTVHDIARHYRSLTSGSILLGNFAEKQASKMEREGAGCGAKFYRSTVRRFVGWHGGDIELRHITDGVMMRYQQSLETGGLTPSTVSFYLRTLKAIYNKAVEEGWTPRPATHPFERVYTRTREPADPAKRQIEQKEAKDREKLDFKEFVLKYADRNLSVRELARLYGYSGETFRQRFLENFGETPSDWFVGRRNAKKGEELEAFVRRYVHSDLTVGELARMYGCSASLFSKRFIACFGEPPSDWLARERSQKVNEEAKARTEEKRAFEQFFLRYVDSELSARELAGLYGYSYETLREKFREYFSDTPGSWLDKQRGAKAKQKQELESFMQRNIHNGLTVSQRAEMYGRKRLYNPFRRYFSDTPGGWLEKQRGAKTEQRRVATSCSCHASSAVLASTPCPTGKIA